MRSPAKRCRPRSPRPMRCPRTSSSGQSRRSSTSRDDAIEGPACHMTRSVVLALVVALALAGCSGSKFSLSASEPQVEPNLVPANLKAELLTFLQVYLEDPTGVRDAFLAPPVLRPLGLESRYVA